MSSFVLGTAQLGMKYGQTNLDGQPSEVQCYEILERSIEAGVGIIDTARAYGDSENIIGQFFKKNPSLLSKVKIITKLNPLENLNQIHPVPLKAQVSQEVTNSIHQSCESLGVNHLDILMLHRWSHRRDYNQVIWSDLLNFKRSGVIKSLGASVQNPSEMVAALFDENIDHIQFPFHLLDWRWDKGGIFEAIQKAKTIKPHLKIYARSIFLQGILLHQKKLWPHFDEVDVESIQLLLNEWVTQFNRKDRTELCIHYVRAFLMLDEFIVGVENVNQLNEHVSCFATAPLMDREVNMIHSKRPHVSERFLNPSEWPK